MSKTVTQERATASGLDNVVAAETNLSHVDGEAGRLIVAGYEVETLVKLTILKVPWPNSGAPRAPRRAI